MRLPLPASQAPANSGAPAVQTNVTRTSIA
jgi:hypothetical protein